MLPAPHITAAEAVRSAPQRALTAAPARAQTYDPAYPVCLHVYNRGSDYYQCRYTSLPQCNASASGRAAQCVINPYFASTEEPAGYRRHRRVY